MPSWHLVCPKLLSVETLVTGSHEGIDDIYHKSLGFSYQVQHLGAVYSFKSTYTLFVDDDFQQEQGAKNQERIGSGDVWLKWT